MPFAGQVSHPRATWLAPATGQVLDNAALMDVMAMQSVVMLGETHDVAEIHRWQLSVATQLFSRVPAMMMGFEMFPRRVQGVLDQWVDGKLSTADFISRSQWDSVWGFPFEIYAPLFHFCRMNGVRMLALNCRRDLVGRVGKEGWDAIAETERDGVSPAAAPTPEYIRRLASFAKRPMGKKTGEPPDAARFMRAMQVWDRAFACRMVDALNDWPAGKPAPLVLGIIGRGHLEYGDGTPYQLRDLGVNHTAVLLPNQEETLTIGGPRKLADAVYRLDTVEPKAVRYAMPKA